MNPNKNINVGSAGNQNLDTRQSQYGVNAGKVGIIRTYTSKVVSLREQFENFLLTQNIKLVTSFSEMVTNKSFINSSYIIYVDQDGKREKLSKFLERNIKLKEVAEKIELEVRKR
jgi:hypothetical protein